LGPHPRHVSPPIVIDTEKASRMPWRAPVPSREEMIRRHAAHRGRCGRRSGSGASGGSPRCRAHRDHRLAARRPAGRPIDVDDGWRADRTSASK
jgi:hypothetical protein